MPRLRIASIVAVLLAACAPAAAQEYPTRTVKIILPLGAGGGSDVFTRVIADELQKRWGQTFVVENRTGGSMNIGTKACAESPPDGYTICVLSSESMVFNQFLFRNLPYDPARDFEPVTNLFVNSVALVVNASLGVKSIPELIALSKARPGTLSYGTFSFPLVHYMNKLRQEAGADIVRVPFRSGNEIVNAIMSGSSPVAFLGLANMVPQIKSGLITAIAVNSYKRSPLFPDLPTLSEVTGENFPPSWFGLFAPAGTPKPIIEKLATEVAHITNEPAFQQKYYVERAVEPAVDTPAAFTRFIAEERKVAERLVSESGLQPQ